MKLFFYLQKEVKIIRKSKKAQKKLGILQKVQEVGPERFLSPAPLEEESEVSEVESDDHPHQQIVKSLLNDFDELEDITPGLLTISRGIRPKPTLDLFGELKPPNPDEVLVPQGRGPGRIVSPGDKRPNLPGGYGVPGKTGTGALQRSDLGSIPTSSMSSSRMFTKPSDDQSFIGTLTTMFFGRKGGLL